MSLDIWTKSFPLIGVIHLPALPGTPHASMSLSKIREGALKEAQTLFEAGFEGIIVENFGDRPFRAGPVEPAVVVSMALVVSDIVQAFSSARRSPCIGVNVLRNDAEAALTIASLCGADFIRVNIHIGAMLTDQGLIEGKAYETLLLRRRLGSHVAVFADVLVKHAVSLGEASLEALAEDTVLRGNAEALIFSGSGTGRPTDLNAFARVGKILPQTPLLIGSGLTLENLEASLACAHGAVVGTALKEERPFGSTISPDRAQAFVKARNAWFNRSKDK